MQTTEGILFSLQKIFFGNDSNGERVRYIEAIAYFRDLRSALDEKRKHPMSFVFPFRCTFHEDRRKTASIIRANYHH